MGHRAHSAFRGRPYGPDPFGRDAQNRIRIAQTAARLIIEHGLADWALAKRKAARQLMLSDREALPDDGEVEAALAEHQALYGGDEHLETLRQQREEAAAWMRRLADFRPTLCGGVAAGWATEHSDIRLELVADDAKTVELALINAGVAYRLPPLRGLDPRTELLVDTAAGGVRLIVRSESAQRQRPHRDAQGNPLPRLSLAALEALLNDSKRPSG
jgi:hypothetical protein